MAGQRRWKFLCHAVGTSKLPEMLGAIPMENDGGKTHNKVNQLVRHFFEWNGHVFFGAPIVLFFFGHIAAAFSPNPAPLGMF